MYSNKLPILQGNYPFYLQQTILFYFLSSQKIPAVKKSTCFVSVLHLLLNLKNTKINVRHRKGRQGKKKFSFHIITVMKHSKPSSFLRRQLTIVTYFLVMTKRKNSIRSVSDTKEYQIFRHRKVRTVFHTSMR